MADLDGTVALVTGGAGAIGSAVADVLTARGATLALADRAPLADRPGASRHAVDVADRRGCHDLVEEVLDVHGRCDVLVNNAGITRRAPVADVDEQDWDALVAVNLSGTFWMCQAAYPALRAARGAVVNVASVLALRPAAGSLPYGVTKAAVLQLTRGLAAEWGPDGVRVNAVAPTIVPTAMTADLVADPAYVERRLAGIPLGRMAEATDVAEAIAYLVSPAASFVSGQVLGVDGGESC